MNIFKIILTIIILVGFYFLIKHYIDLENYKFNYDQSTIHIIDADNKPFKILPPPEDINNPMEDSCTLNDEC